MQATVLRQFKGCPDGEQVTRGFVPGDKIYGELASAMIDAGYAKDDSEAATAEKKPRVKKAIKGAPRNKAG